MKTITVASNNSMNHGPFRLALLLIPLALACFAVLPQAQATCQEGCLANENTVFGDDALLNNTGDDNTAVGFNALLSNTTGFRNTAVGYQALFSNTTSPENTAIGSFALFSNTTGTTNTAVGDVALSHNTTGSDNTAVGVAALIDNTAGFSNTAIGRAALESNTIGNQNTATGFAALFFNSTGNENTATGGNALNNNTIGNNNTATGYAALQSNSGNDNTATGVNALFNNTRGHDNTATGFGALANNTTGSNNIAVGKNAGVNLTTGGSNIHIGNVGIAGESKIIRIGKQGLQANTYVAGINGVTIPTGAAVVIDTSGHLGTTTSSVRFKEDIKPMDKASETILALNPVTFRYKHDLDAKGIPQFGLVAEEVEKVNPDLVARDDEGKPYTVRYDAVNAMLLNEFLKEHRKVESLERVMEEQHKENAAMRAMLKEQAVQIQKVSAKLELTKPSAQTVLSNR